MIRFNPSDIYRRSIEDDNQRMREEIGSLTARLEVETAQVIKLRGEIKELHGQIYKHENGGWN